ncbi:Ig-like domain-containing protein [Psychroserpens sp.]|uniref:Ig-like domain-containing protein n=1 Tax=Psychroserpens sp. TaxID=2020870 RepID=UPI001B29520A|nr:Ig-like domain-containing protein [Psychroserpens sp.]MBO6605598.1 Ig-like domain-containing protein [Psychroserpens sp.]MBO6632376.1 Ig-like domain-containing protein [Psychroserpens sp.]MBO6653593.1 Ig-like domain-containing protein [Psychroserpens sp.]MBO6681914.1 Ig-like domain-containing protein [Psychroserpens sp.]MBO6748972.1 Ig-like domain-containing protein [Psychroserpens sp.]
MFKTFLKISGLFLCLSAVLSCANRGRPEGGPKDVDAPVIIRSTPDNFTTNFDGKEIRVYFDEYVKVKNLQKQLIISPPMDPEPTITPLGSASKYIKIIINDTLLENTTYAFNFGQSIVDNNEENPYDYYRYVLSTGDYIDSLSVKGQVFDAKERAADEFISVMLYEIDSTYSDSIVYKQKPKYITNTLDSTTTFSIDNIKAGTYKLIALKDENGNFTFQQNGDKIGFYEGYITVPTDSLYSIKLFNEELDFDVKRPKQAAGQKIAFGYEGDYKNMRVELLGERPDNYVTRLTKDESSDTLYYWYKPKIEKDSALFRITNKTFVDTLNHRYRQLENDSLIVRVASNSTLTFDEDFRIAANIPIEKFDKRQVKIIDKDSIDVAFETAFDTLNNTYSFIFEKQQSQKYNVQLLPGAFEDFFGNVNDTININARTKTYADYSNLRVTLKNVKSYPIIVQLVNERGELQYEQFADEPRMFDFKAIAPVNYFIRVVYDTNGNRKWDTGNYLKQVQPEEIRYSNIVEETRANWDPVIEFILD